MPHSPVPIPVQGHARLRLATASGRISVVAEARDDILVVRGLADGPGATRQEDGWLVLKPEHRSSTFEVRVPEGSDIAAGTGSARVEIRGRVGAVLVTTASGRIDVEEAEALDARGQSGPIRVGSVAKGRIQTVSGTIEIGRAGRVKVDSVSGRVAVQTLTGEARVRVASSRVDIALERRAMIAVESLSGAITITVPPGSHPDVRARTRGGEPDISVQAGNDCRVMARSLSGRIRVAEA